MTNEQIKLIRFHLSSIQKIISTFEDHPKRYEKVIWQNQRKVQCVETGKTYESIRQAARLTGCSAPEISLCCKGKQSQVKGFHWMYVG